MAHIDECVIYRARYDLCCQIHMLTTMDWGLVSTGPPVTARSVSMGCLCHLARLAEQALLNRKLKLGVFFFSIYSTKQCDTVYLKKHTDI